MNLRDLEYLVAVADHRHFGRAAAAVFVSQPTLSTQIRKLEHELGVELFERNPRRVLLTETGERIVEQARVVLRESAVIGEIARQSTDPESGTLRLGIFPTLGPYLLPHVVPAVRERFPRLELLLIEEKTDELVGRLLAGRLDVAVLATPVLDGTVESVPLFEERFVLAVPSEHRLARRRARTVGAEVLEGESVLLLDEGHCLRDQALSVCQLSGAGERSGFRATSLETLRQMVAAGVGITLLPELAVRPPVPVNDRIRLLRFADPAPTRHVVMCWRRTSALRGFLPRLADAFRPTP